ncbi:MAG: CPBP family intramembrane metalloprotease [Sphingomonas sp.]|uniref:CPBP family intramembrane glutamic endopeptidase n=1 Tax=Sphingomonas sp. TaxID=28214 RepID=UPI0025EF6543|nr:CPBP family intramembrane glutamic endopeptidase [Sphingomonas sp.]MBX3563675.1 CPBP family intramembrane metalloprotease [Sphingomonas sp.]
MEAVELGNARVLRPGKLLWLRAMGWMVALFVLIVAFAALFANGMLRVGTAASGATFTRPELVPEPIKFTVIALTAVLVLLLYRGAVRFAENRRVPELSLREMPAELIGGLLVGALLMAGSIGLLWATGWAVVTPKPIAAILPAIRSSIQSGVIEEVVFRLIVFRLCWRAFGPWWALAISALLFGALHLGNPNATIFAAICIALEAGILLATFYILTGRIWAPIGVHAGWNFTQGWVFGAAVSGGSGGFNGGPLSTQPAAGVPEMLSGGGFGPEASLPGLLVCTAAGLSLLWLSWRKGRMTAAG